MAAITGKKNNKKVLTFSELLELKEKREQEERVRELEDEQEEREREREREQLEMVNLKWKHLIFEQPRSNPSGRGVTWGSNTIHDIHYDHPDSSHHFLSSNNKTVTAFNDSNKNDTTNSNDSNQSTQRTSNCTMQRNHRTRGRTDMLEKDPTLFRERRLKRRLKLKQHKQTIPTTSNCTKKRG